MSNESATPKQAKPETKAPPPAALDHGARTDQADAIVRRNVLWSLGAGAIPVPFVDVLAVSAVQVKMLKQLSDLYGQPFSESIAKKLVVSLLTGLGGVGLGVAFGAAIGGSLAKLLPAVGTTLGVLSVPLFAGAFTHATGRVFTMHFESGGTMLNFDARAMRAYFKQEFEKAKDVVSQLQSEQQAKAGNKPS